MGTEEFPLRLVATAHPLHLIEEVRSTLNESVMTTLAITEGGLPVSRSVGENIGRCEEECSTTSTDETERGRGVELRGGTRIKERGGDIPNSRKRRSISIKRSIQVGN